VVVAVLAVAKAISNLSATSEMARRSDDRRDFDGRGLYPSSNA